jgi:hypothetical protein
VRRVRGCVFRDPSIGDTDHGIAHSQHTPSRGYCILSHVNEPASSHVCPLGLHAAEVRCPYTLDSSDICCSAPKSCRIVLHPGPGFIIVYNTHSYIVVPFPPARPWFDLCLVVVQASLSTLRRVTT